MHGHRARSSRRADHRPRPHPCPVCRPAGPPVAPAAGLGRVHSSGHCHCPRDEGAGPPLVPSAQASRAGLLPAWQPCNRFSGTPCCWGAACLATLFGGACGAAWGPAGQQWQVRQLSWACLPAHASTLSTGSCRINCHSTNFRSSIRSTCRVIQCLGLLMGLVGFGLGFAIAGGWNGRFQVGKGLRRL